MTLSGQSGTQGGGTILTDASGNYSFSVLAGGSYSVTPSLSGDSFSPASQTFNNLSANQVQNFIASPVAGPFTISGQITISGNGLFGFTLTLSGSQSGATTTNSSGNYSFSVPAGGSYTVTPSLGGDFSPASQTFNNLSSNQTQNFVASPAGSATISGQVTSFRKRSERRHHDTERITERACHHHYRRLWKLQFLSPGRRQLLPYTIAEWRQLQSAQPALPQRDCQPDAEFHRFSHRSVGEQRFHRPWLSVCPVLVRHAPGRRQLHRSAPHTRIHHRPIWQSGSSLPDLERNADRQLPRQCLYRYEFRWIDASLGLRRGPMDHHIHVIK